LKQIKVILKAHRARDRRGAGATGKTPVFGLLKRDDKVLVSFVKHCSKKSLCPLLRRGA
jgi:transposase